VQPVAVKPEDSKDEVPMDEDIHVLSPFEVTTAKDVGFASTSSLAGGRLATDLKDTPVAYSVINKEMIDTLGLTDLTQAAEWTTNTFKFADGSGGGDTFNITTPITVRGVSNISQLRQRNFFIYFSENDAYNIERYDFGRGPNQILFGNGTVGGTQITMTKRARVDKQFGSVEAGYGSWANQRYVIDVNEPLGKKSAFRLSTLWADREGWRDNEMEMRKAAFLTTTFKLTKTTDLRVEGEIGRIERRIPDAKLTEKFAGWNGTYNAGYLAATPSNSTALGIDRRGGNYYVYSPDSGQDAIFGLSNWAMTRGAGDTVTTPAGNYFQVGSTSWNQTNATILNAIDVVPDRFDRALENSYFNIPSRSFTNSPSTPTITSDFKDLQINLDQRVGDTLFFQLGADFNRVENDINRVESDLTTTYIDINPTLPGGATNPNYLKPYGDGKYWFSNKDSHVKSVRAGVAYKLDLQNWGNYNFGIMGGLTNQVNKTRNRVLVADTGTLQFVDRRQWANTDNALRRRYYWNGSRNYDVPPTTLTYYNSVTGAATTVNTVWVPAAGGTDSTNNMNDAIADYNYLTFSSQAKFFKDRLVITAAARYDDSKQVVHYLKRIGDFGSDWDGQTLYWREDAPDDWATLVAARPRTTGSTGIGENAGVAGVRYGDDYNPPPIVSKVWTPSTGAALHLSDWFTVFGNYAKAISFNAAAAPDVYSRLLPAVEGKGTDFGVRFIFLDNRINFSVTRYHNEEYGNYIDPTSTTNNINALYTSNDLGDKTANGNSSLASSPISTVVRDTRTRISEGLEFELITQVTQGWRVSANLGLPQVTEREVAPMTRAYIAANADRFKQIVVLAGGSFDATGAALLPVGYKSDGETEGHETLKAVNAYNTLYMNANSLVTGSRKATGSADSLNVFTDYTIQAGMLKNLKFGAGINYRGRRVVGYKGADTIATSATTAADDPSVDGYSPLYAPGYSLVTATLGYKWKISRRYSLDLNLRVSNLLNNDKVMYTDGTLVLRPKDGDFTSPARQLTYAPYAYQTPRNYSLTAKLNF